MILSDGTCVSKGRRTRTRKIKGNCGTNASFKSFISIEMQLWLPLSFASLLTFLWDSPCSIMNFARHNMRERGGNNTDKENLGELWDIYYNNRSPLFPEP